MIKYYCVLLIKLLGLTALGWTLLISSCMFIAAFDDATDAEGNFKDILKCVGSTILFLIAIAAGLTWIHYGW